MRIQLKAEFATENIFAEITCGAGFVQGAFKRFVFGPNFTVNIVIAGLNAERIGANNHALDHAVRVVAHDVAVFIRAGLAFVGITHDKFSAFEMAWNKTPLQSGGEPCSTATAQTGSLQLIDDGDGLDVFSQDFL